MLQVRHDDFQLAPLVTHRDHVGNESEGCYHHSSIWDDLGALIIVCLGGNVILKPHWDG